MSKRTQLIKTLGLSLLATGLVLPAAGCGSSDPHSASEGARAGSPRSMAGMPRRYSACMRSHGIASFPYPRRESTGPGEERVLVIGALTHRVISSPRFSAAQRACRGIVPGARFATATQQSEAIRARGRLLIAFARCVRRHGVPRFPASNAQGQFTRAMIHRAGLEPRSPALVRAARACAGDTH